MNRKQQATLRQIMARPVRANVRWTDFVSLMKALGADVEEGRGSRVRFLFDRAAATFHRPHPSAFMDNGAVSSAQELLRTLGVAK